MSYGNPVLGALVDPWTARRPPPATQRDWWEASGRRARAWDARGRQKSLRDEEAGDVESLVHRPWLSPCRTSSAPGR